MYIYIKEKKKTRGGLQKKNIYWIKVYFILKKKLLRTRTNKGILEIHQNINCEFELKY
jgi:hypothetical protein